VPKSSLSLFFRLPDRSAGEFFKKPQSAKRRKLGENSIVRPTFSYYGKLFVADAAIAATSNRSDKRYVDYRTGQVSIKIRRTGKKGFPSPWT
jgi:hypothetical protein